MDGHGEPAVLRLLQTEATDSAKALAKYPIAQKPFVKALTKGLPEDMPCGAVLERVPLIGVAFTAFDIFANWRDGKGIGADVQPVANLAIGTAAAEGMSSLLAAQSLDFIPGVGEVVIAGTVVVGVVYGADQLGKLVWDNRQAIGRFVIKVGDQELHLAKDVYGYGNEAFQYLSSTATEVVNTSEQVAGTIMHTGGQVLNTVENTGGAVLNTVGQGIEDAAPWNWG